MENEVAFLLLSLASLTFAYIAFRLGKAWLIGYTVATLLLANVIGPKIISVFGFAITAGTALFAGLPLATDLLSERYGKKMAQKAVLIAFGGMMIFSVMSLLVLQMQVLPFALAAGDAIDTILSTSIRLMIASPVAYLIWQLIDINIYEYLHKRTGQGYLWLRNNVSTIIAQAGSTMTFFALGFAGTGQPWLEIAIITIGFYWVIALIDTVMMYASRNVNPLDTKI